MRLVPAILWHLNYTSISSNLWVHSFSLSHSIQESSSSNVLWHMRLVWVILCIFLRDREELSGVAVLRDPKVSQTMVMKR